MEKFDEFMNIFFTDELVLVFLAVVAIILFIFIVYLIKLEREDKRRMVEESNHWRSDDEDIVLPKKEIIHEEESEPEMDPLGIFNSLIEENDEEAAIISTDELMKASKEMSDTLKMDTSEIIDMFENEQEKKAIISYDELLKNAASLNIKYEEPKEKELDKVVVKKIESVETSKVDMSEVESSNRVLNYVEEEEFLKALKRFRMDLKT